MSRHARAAHVRADHLRVVLACALTPISGAGWGGFWKDEAQVMAKQRVLFVCARWGQRGDWSVTDFMQLLAKST